MRGKTERFISIGGVPAYRGYSNPGVLTPHGLPVPVAEDWTKSTDRSEDEKGYRVFRSEAVVFESHPTATHFAIRSSTVRTNSCRASGASCVAYAIGARTSCWPTAA
jgi:hypothetical protein